MTDGANAALSVNNKMLKYCTVVMSTKLIISENDASDEMFLDVPTRT